MNDKELQIKRLGKQDILLFQKLITMFQEVFETGGSRAPSQTYLVSLLAKPGFIVYAAILDNEVTGGLTAYELPMYHYERSELYIYDIAVSESFRGKAVGKSLLLALGKYCREHNIKVMFVEANEEDEGAVKFYHAAGGKAEKVVHFNFDFS